MAVVPQHAVATTDGAGDAVFTFPDVPQGELWSGTTQIPGATANATGVVTGGGQLLGSISGPGSYGPWTCDYTQKLAIAMVGLAPDTQYVAIWHADDRGAEYSTYPAPITPTVTGSVTVPDPLPVSQSTSPWVVSGSTSISGSVSVTQGTSPWVVSGTVGVAGTVTTAPTLAGSPAAGQVTMTGSPVALPSHAAVQGVTLSAPKTNASAVTINGATGFVINPGEMTPLLPVTNSNVFTADGTVPDVLSFLVT